MKKPVLYASLALISALLAACGNHYSSTLPVVPDPRVAPTRVSGTLSGWTGGSGSIEMLADDSSSRSSSNPVLATGTLNADGSFDVALPDADAVTPYLVPAENLFVPSSATCSGDFFSSNGAARTFVSSRLDVRQDGAYVTTAEPIQFTDQSSGSSLKSTDVRRFWVYADQPTTLGGSQDCTDSHAGLTTTSHATLNAPLERGWNLMTETSVISTTQGSGQATAEVTLHLTDDSSGPWMAVNLSRQALKGWARISDWTVR